jgi:hypothetical protein
MDLLDSLERRLGRYAIPNLLGYVAAGQAVAWMLTKLRPDAAQVFMLDRGLVMQGQVWRLFTWVFDPPASGPIWAFFGIYFLWFMGSALDHAWGSFRLNAYYLIGVLLHIALALLLPWAEISPSYLHLSVFLAFALEFPDFEILLFFILPVKVKWLAMLNGLLLLFSLAAGSWSTRWLVLVSLLNFALFFAPVLLRRLRQQHAVAGNMAAFHRSQREASKAPAKLCSVCRATPEAADIRICHCGQCPAEGRFFCMEHLKQHLEPAAGPVADGAKTKAQRSRAKPKR